MENAGNEVDSVLKSPEDPSDGSGRVLYEQIYEDLRALSRSMMSKEYVYSTLQATALVNEAWIRLGGDEQTDWKSRRHLFAAAAEAMRRILVERARRRMRKKHGGEYRRVDPVYLKKVGTEIHLDDEFLKINDALEKFETEDPEKAELVRLRYFFGFSFEEVSELMGVSVSTAKRMWAYARSWLHDEVSSY